MKIFTLLLTLVITTLIVLSTSPLHQHTVQAWWCMGHGLVAQIALNNVEPHVRDVTNRYFEYLSQVGPFPKVTDAVSGACWADDVKEYGLTPTGGWHFKDIPYYFDNATLPDGFCIIQDSNLVTSIGKFFKAARLKPEDTNPYSIAFALAYVVHNYGDVHQPLHCASFVEEKKFPKGDAGGNFIHIKWQNESTNLHKYWDSICFQREYDDLVRPMSPQSKQFMYDTAMKFNKTWNNISLYEGTLHYADIMAEQSFEKAKQYVYADLIVGPNNISTDGSEEVPEWYQKRCIPVAERQIVLGGMRLAYTLTTLFKDAPMPELLKIENHSPMDFGARETGIFFGGFAASLFVVAASWFLYTFVWKEGNSTGGVPLSSRGTARNKGNDVTPLVSTSGNGGGGGQPQRTTEREVRTSLYTEAH